MRPEGALSPPHRRLSSRRSINPPHSLSNLLQSIKGTFSRSLPKGTFWQRRSYVLHVESENYLDTLIDYIRFNYTKMDLPEEYGHAPFVYFNNKNLRDLFWFVKTLPSFLRLQSSTFRFFKPRDADKPTEGDNFNPLLLEFIRK